MFETLKADFQRIYWNYPSREPENLFKKIWVIINSQGFQALSIYRLQRWCMEPATWPGMALVNKILFFIGSIFQKAIILIYDINISRDAVIGKGLCIHHFGGIAIGPCRIGENCTIAQQVKISAENIKDISCGAILDDRVWVGGHVSIIGKVHIGKGSTLSSGAIIKKNIPNNHLVGGKQGRILNKNFDNAMLHNLPDF